MRMPIPENDPLDPGLKSRLKAALDQVTPPPALPRYAAATTGRARVGRAASLALAAGASVLLALTATATTGSPNPVVWTQRAASEIEAVEHGAKGSPTPESTNEAKETPKNVTGVQPTSPPERETSPEPTEHPAQSPQAEPSGSPSPGDDHGDGFNPSPSPTSSGPDTGTGSPTPSPAPGDH
jgi:hypothetical protein